MNEKPTDFPKPSYIYRIQVEKNFVANANLGKGAQFLCVCRDAKSLSSMNSYLYLRLCLRKNNIPHMWLPLM